MLEPLKLIAPKHGLLSELSSKLLKEACIGYSIWFRVWGLGFRV